MKSFKEYVVIVVLLVLALSVSIGKPVFAYTISTFDSQTYWEQYCSGSYDGEFGYNYMTYTYGGSLKAFPIYASSVIPEGAGVRTANFRLWVRTQSYETSFTFSTPSGGSVNTGVTTGAWSEYRDYDITNIVRNHISNGGNRDFPIGIYSSGYCKIGVNGHNGYCGYSPKLDVTYGVRPTEPVISNPSSTRYEGDTLPITLRSTQADNNTIKFEIQYKESDGITWNQLVTTGYTSSGNSLNYSWDISSLEWGDYVIRVKAIDCYGGYSVWETSEVFKVGPDPAEAARIAAEEAREAVNEIKDILERDVEPPVITRFSPIIDRVMLVRNNIEQFYVIARDNRTANNELQYRYKVGTGVYSEWADLENQVVNLNLGSTNGYKQITLEVKDLAGNIALESMGVFKI